MPAFVMPPLETVSPLECSEGTRPAHAPSAGALPKRERSPTSAASAWAVTVSMPLRHLRASTVGLHLGLPADSATLASRPRFASSHLATHSR